MLTFDAMKKVMLSLCAVGLLASTAAVAGVGPQGLQAQGLQVQGLQAQGLQVQGLQVQGLQAQGLQAQGLSVRGANLQEGNFKEGRPAADCSPPGTGLRLSGVTAVRGRLVR